MGRTVDRGSGHVSAFEDPAQNADLRWLRANLGEGVGRVTYGSISKLKGIEADAVVITDVGQEAQTWAAEHGLDWDDLLYVALSRAKYRAVGIATLPLAGEAGKDRAAATKS